MQVGLSTTDSCINVQNALNRRVEIVFNPKKKIKNVKESIFLEFDNFKLKDTFQPQLKNIAQKIKEQNKLNVMLIGYSDSINDVVSSQKRIESVKSFFESSGISAHSIDIEINIIISNISKEQAILNRRVEVVVFEKE